MDLKETTDKVIKYKLKYSAQELEDKLDKVDQEYSLEEKEKLNGLKNYDDSQIKSDVNTLTENKLDKNQGTENSGKVLGTNANGEVVPLNGYGFEYDEETKMLKYGTDPTSNLNQGIGLDHTLSKRGYAADASAVGELKGDLSDLESDLEDAFVFEKMTEECSTINQGEGYWKIQGGKAVFVERSGTYFHAQYFEIIDTKSNYKLTVRCVDSTVNNYIFVDGEYNVLESSDVGGIANTYYEYDLVIPTNAKYQLFSSKGLGEPRKYLIREYTEKILKDFVKNPIVITVKKDGTGDYETIRGALDSITDANSKTNPYVIEVYEGIYEVFEDYTNEEILSAGTEHYTDTSFVGLKFTDGISLRGVGVRENIIIHGEVSTDYEQSIRNNLSTLNFQGTMSCENVTVTAKNIRYAVHDDFTNQSGAIRKVKNCNFFGSALTSGTSGQSYGMGQRPNDNAVFENCDFGVTFLWHSANLASAINPSSIMLLNCKAIQCSLVNYNHNVVNSVHLNNCDFDSVIISFKSGTSDTNNCKLFGVGTNSMINSPSDYIYEINGVKRFIKPSSNVLSVGQLVSVGSALYWEGTINKTTNKDIAYGVIVGVDDKYYYVQKNGYISSDRFNLDDLSVGDYVTIDTNGIIVGGGTKENAIGVVKRVGSGIGYIKLLIN